MHISYDTFILSTNKYYTNYNRTGTIGCLDRGSHIINCDYETNVSCTHYSLTNNLLGIRTVSTSKRQNRTWVRHSYYKLRPHVFQYEPEPARSASPERVPPEE